jgi:HEAT repeat protein
VTSSWLFFAAGASVCLAAAIWLVLIAARAIRIALGRRSRSSRTAAAIALGRFEQDRDLEALAKALAPIPPETLAPTLARRLGGLEPALADGVRSALERVQLRRQLLPRFRSAPEGTRLLYCELLGDLPGDGAVPTLEGALSDYSPLVRMAAAMSLARLGAAPPPRELLSRLGAKACGSARLALLFELLLPEREVEVAEIAADASLAPRTRLSALRGLALARIDGYPRLLQSLADDASPAVAAEVARALPQAIVEAPTVLSGLLAHKSGKVRREAAGAAGAADTGRLAIPLKRLLLDRNPTVASRAARVLSERAGEGRLAPTEGAA